MRRNSFFFPVWVMALVAAVAGCGGSSSSTTQTAPPTGIKKRVLGTNQQTSTVNIIDGQRDTVSTKTLAASGANKIITSGGTTVVMDGVNPNITIIDNATEAVTFPTPIG